MVTTHPLLRNPRPATALRPGLAVLRSADRTYSTQPTDRRDRLINHMVTTPFLHHLIRSASATYYPQAPGRVLSTDSTNWSVLSALPRSPAFCLTASIAEPTYLDTTPRCHATTRRCGSSNTPHGQRHLLHPSLRPARQHLARQ